MAAQGVVVGIARVGAGGAIGVFFHAEGIGSEAGAATGDVATQDAGAGSVVGVPGLARAACIPGDQVIERIEGEAGRGAARVAAARIAPTVIAGRVVGGFARVVGAACAARDRVEADQLVRFVRVAVEILLLGATAAQRPLPELAQVGVDKATAIRRPAQTVRQAASACGGLGAGVTRPDQPVLLVIAEVLRLAAAGAALPWNGGMGRADTDDIADRVIRAARAEEGTGRAAAALPACRT